jgi:hypothetical protein
MKMRRILGSDELDMEPIRLGAKNDDEIIVLTVQELLGLSAHLRSFMGQ